MTILAPAPWSTTHRIPCVLAVAEDGKEIVACIAGVVGRNVPLTVEGDSAVERLSLVMHLRKLGYRVTEDNSDEGH